MEEYQLILPSELGLDAEEFAETWNSDRTYRSIGVVEEEDETARSFEPAAMDALITISTTVGLGILTNAIYDQVKKLWERKKEPPKHIKIKQIEKPDGTKMLFVEIEEK